MTVDVISIILLALAIFKGYRQGVIVAIFSLLAIVIGLAAAMKLSVTVAAYFAAQGFHGQWLSFISFLLVMILVIVIVKIIANLIQKTVEAVLMGWLNRLTGIAFYILLYFIIYSVLLFYAQKLGILSQDTLQKSTTYVYIKNIGPWIINHLGNFIPWFRDMFATLSHFFTEVAQQIPR